MRPAVPRGVSFYSDSGCPPSVRPSLQDGMFQNEFQRAYVGDGGALSMPPACRPACLLAAHGQTARVNDGRRPLPLPPLPPRFACLAHPKLPVCSVRMWIHSRNHAGGQGTALLCSVLFCAARIDARAASRQPSLFPSHADHRVSTVCAMHIWVAAALLGRGSRGGILTRGRRDC